ncbi:MAG: DUF5719 family protein, partial [Actinomycetota bacterium]
MRKRLLIAVAATLMVVALQLPVFIFPGAALAQPLDWERVNQDGFGFAPPGEMGSALSMAEYDGHLYAGTMNWENANGCAVWRYDGGTDWTQVASGGFGDTGNQGIFCLEVYAGMLFAGTYNETTGAEVWAYDGVDWTQYVGQGAAGDPTGPGFGDGLACEAAGDMAVLGGMLYVGTGWGTGSVAKIWAFDGSTWTQANDDGFGDPTNRGSRALAIYDGQLYAGTNGGSGGGQLWRYDGPDPADWTQLTGDAFGTGDYEVRVIESWNGQLYAGTAGTDYPTVWAYNGTVWDDVTPTYPDDKNDSVRSMAVYKDALYVGVGNYSGAIPLENVGTQVWRYDGGAPEQVNLNGFDGDPKNMGCHSLCEFQGDLYAGVMNVDWGPSPEVYGGAQVWRTNVPSTWYLAEGSTAGGMQTYILVQNPNPDPVTVDLTLMTDQGEKKPTELQNQTIPKNSRRTFPLHAYITTYDVSTKVEATGGEVICERAMYSGDWSWGHDSIGVTMPAPVWYLAEGSTAGGMQTYILVQNPNPDPVTVDLTLMTDQGEKKPA